LDIKGLVVIVTGASAGIGRVTAVTLARSGAHVVVTARRESRLLELAAEIAELPGECLVVAGDIQDEAFTQELIKQAVAKWGRVDVVVNNAGLGHRSFLTEMPLADMRTIWNTNVMGLMALTQAAVGQMRQQGSGQIINVSSIVSQRPLPSSGVYCASKTAVNFLSRSLRLELKASNIIVSLVYPGLTATEFAQARLGEVGGSRFGLKGIAPERVAQAIVKAIRYGRTEVYITWTDWLFTHINRLFPRLIDWGISRTNLIS
jgi:short-subunit dehydrogenase